jgi:hypothetical protein
MFRTFRPIVTTREAGEARPHRAVRRTAARWTAKSCCPGAPTLALSMRARRVPHATLANKPGTPRRPRISRSSSRRECRMFGWTCGDCRQLFSAGGPCVAASARHSPAFPAPSSHLEGATMDRSDVSASRGGQPASAVCNVDRDETVLPPSLRGPKRRVDQHLRAERLDASLGSQ